MTKESIKRVRMFSVELVLLAQMLGTSAKDPEVYKNFIASKAPEETNTDNETMKNTSISDEENKGWTGFLNDEEGNFMKAYMIKGFMNHAANVMKDVFGVSAFKSKIKNYVHIFPDKIRLPEIEDKPVERPLRASTPKGERVTVVRSDSIAEGTVIKFDLLFVYHKDLSAEILEKLFMYGQLSGLLQFRSGGYGKFSSKIKEYETIPEQYKDLAAALSPMV